MERISDTVIIKALYQRGLDSFVFRRGELIIPTHIEIESHNRPFRNLQVEQNDRLEKERENPNLSRFIKAYKELMCPYQYYTEVPILIGQLPENRRLWIEMCPDRKYRKRNKFFVDVYIPKLDLFLELDSTWHDGMEEYDRIRREYIFSKLGTPIEHLEFSQNYIKAKNKLRELIVGRRRPEITNSLNYYHQELNKVLVYDFRMAFQIYIDLLEKYLPKGVSLYESNIQGGVYKGLNLKLPEELEESIGKLYYNPYFEKGKKGYHETYKWYIEYLSWLLFDRPPYGDIDIRSAKILKKKYLDP